jgi:ATP synthase protein I
VTGRTISTVAKVLSLQILIVFVVSLGFAIRGWQEAYSSLLGGIAAFVPNLYFALKLGSAASKDAKSMLNSFYRGEFIKILLTAALFALILQVPSIKVLPLFAGYAAALTVFWFALIMR